MVDTGATYTFIEQEILEKVGALILPTKVEIELRDG
jgi:predicted aspartyl protease